MSEYPDWQLAFVLPNLCFGTADRSRRELTLGLESMAIVPASDPRVLEITEWSEAAKSFLRSFHDGNGKPITPAALIVRHDWHRDIGRDPKPVISFRNAAAVAAILPFRAHWQSDGWAGVSWSEAFDYHPAQLRVDGSKFDAFAVPQKVPWGAPTVECKSAVYTPPLTPTASTPTTARTRRPGHRSPSPGCSPRRSRRL